MKLNRETCCEKICEAAHVITLVSIGVFIGSVVASLVTGCAVISRILPETTKEATSAAPEIQEAVDSKGVEVIDKGKDETVRRLNKL